MSDAYCAYHKNTVRFSLKIQGTLCQISKRIKLLNAVEMADWKLNLPNVFMIFKLLSRQFFSDAGDSINNTTCKKNELISSGNFPRNLVWQKL